MRVFITWSGAVSLRLGRALRDWLPGVLPYVEPWLSAEDISRGTRWTPELWNTLRSSQFGILCLVSGMERRPWVLFEAGVLACSQAEDRVAPFVIGLEPGDLPGPLGLFQCVTAERSDVLSLLKSINDIAGPESISEGEIEAGFRARWPGFRQRLRRIESACASSAEEPPSPPAEDLPEDEEAPDLDVLAFRVLVTLANSIHESESAYLLALQVRRSERIVGLKLKDLQEWGLVEPVPAPYGPPEYQVTQDGLRALDKHGLVR